jgi:hypothetical protein
MSALMIPDLVLLLQLTLLLVDSRAISDSYIVEATRGKVIQYLTRSEAPRHGPTTFFRSECRASGDWPLRLLEMLLLRPWRLGGV